jgi:uncharacterized protein (TIGR02300 family)
LAKAEWGEKRQCPKCGTRFYDLGQHDPIICISCEVKFKPEVILKSKHQAFEITEKVKEESKEDDSVDLLDDDALLNADDDEDANVDVDDNTTVLSDDDNTNVSDVVDTSAPKISDEN